MCSKRGCVERNFPVFSGEYTNMAAYMPEKRQVAAVSKLNFEGAIMKNFRKSMLTLSTAVAVGGLVAAYVPAMAAGTDSSAPAANPCSAKTATPCAAKKPMHHSKHHKATNNTSDEKMSPCAAKTNPCAAKSNPCTANSNPCAAKSNPCAAKANPCTPH